MSDFALPLPQPKTTRARGTLRSAIFAQINVLHALMLHDIKGRFFGNGLGYILTILWPGAHVAIIVIAHSVVHKELPYGDSALVYASTGVMPYIAWNYISRFTMNAAVQNSSFRQYPIVTALDIMVARQALEIVSITIVTCGLIAVILLAGDNPMPAHPADAALGLLSAIFLGIGFGIFNAVIASLFPMWLLCYILVLLACYFTSGVVLINPEALPAVYGDMLAWNPLLHSVEWIRTAYYDDYPHRLLSKVYVLYSAFIFLVGGLIFERIARHIK